MCTELAIYVTKFAKRGLIHTFINTEKFRFEILITVYLEKHGASYTNFSTNLYLYKVIQLVLCLMAC